MPTSAQCSAVRLKRTVREEVFPTEPFPPRRLGLDGSRSRPTSAQQQRQAKTKSEPQHATLVLQPPPSQRPQSASGARRVRIPGDSFDQVQQQAREGAARTLQADIANYGALRQVMHHRQHAGDPHPRTRTREVTSEFSQLPVRDPFFEMNDKTARNPYSSVGIGTVSLEMLFPL